MIVFDIVIYAIFFQQFLFSANYLIYINVTKFLSIFSLLSQCNSVFDTRVWDFQGAYSVYLGEIRWY